MAGSGSVQKRGKNSWRLRYSAGKDKNGKYILKQKTVTAKNITEARKILAEFITEIEAGEYIDPSKMKFKDFVNEWRSKYGEKHLSATTIEERDYKLNGHIIPEFGEKRIDEIQSIDILNYLDSLEKDGVRLDGKSGGYSSSTINHHYQALKDIFDRAVDWKLIKDSPVKGIKRPKVRYKKFQVYDEGKARMVFDKLLDEPIHWRIYFTLALTCGFRRGELLGLQEKHLDFVNNKIHIECQLRYTKTNGYEFVNPKKDSFRTVSVSPIIMGELEQYVEKIKKQRKQAAELWEGGKYLLIFSTWNGKPFNTDVPRKWWKRFTERTGIPYIRPHDFRHTSASILINKGVHDEIVKERLGHSDIKMMNVYAHVFEQSDVAAASEFDSIFNKDDQ